MNEQIYTNYRLQLIDQEILGTLVVREGIIADIQPGIVSQGQNGQADYLMPGLVELHTDNLEQCIAPRPNVRFPLEIAAVHHDRDLISAGITTVCDAIALGDVTPTSLRLTQFAPIISILEQGQKQGRFVANHRLHLRCELSYEQVYELAEQYADHPLLSLISLMDHTPGQRQFASMDNFKNYYIRKLGFTIDEVNEFIQTRIDAQQNYSSRNRDSLVKLARSKGISLASHDDETIDHVQQAVQDGVEIAEFPTTRSAAEKAHHCGLQILMGAPNLILGGSQSGNISAMELVSQDWVDIISSDYVPQSLLQAMFLIAGHLKKPLYQAMQLFTINPARAIGVDNDCGSLEVGKRADLITVHHDGVVPRLTSVIRSGLRVA